MTSPQKQLGHSGFTTIGVFMFVTVQALVFPFLTRSYSSAQMNAKDAKRKADLETVRSALVLYRVDHGRYPKHSDADEKKNFDLAVQDVVSSGYLSSPITDPEGGTGYRYQSNGTTFTVCATLESPSSTEYCVQSP